MTTILGGGIAGLSAAYYALRNPKLDSLIIFEASDRIGGWIRSKKLPSGITFEQGPRTIKFRGTGGSNTLCLIEDLKLTEKLVPITNSHPAMRNRLCYAENGLHLLPSSFRSLFKTTPLLKRSWISALWNDLKAPKGTNKDESVYSFVERRLGKDIADTVVSALVCGIYAGDARQISVHSIMSPLFEAEQSHRSITRGMFAKMFGKKAVKEKNGAVSTDKQSVDMEVESSPLVDKARRQRWAVWGMQGGLEQLPLALANRLQQCDVNIKTRNKCEQLIFKPDHVELVVNGETKQCSRVISSLPAKNLAELLKDQHRPLADELSAIPTVTVGVVNLQFSEYLLPIESFGFLVPPKEKLPILGVTFDTCVIPQNASTVLTVMMGGAWFEEYFGKDPTEEHLLTIAIEQVKKILHIKEDPTAVNVAILKDCIPQHVVGYQERFERIRNYISKQQLPLVLCGSSYEAVGVNGVILSAKEAISSIT